MTAQIYTVFCSHRTMHKFRINIFGMKQNQDVRKTNLIYLLIWKLETNVLVDITETEFNYTPVYIEPRHEKTGFLHMRKQRCRSAAQ